MLITKSAMSVHRQQIQFETIHFQAKYIWACSSTGQKPNSTYMVLILHTLEMSYFWANII